MTDHVDVEIGARVHAAMWRGRVTQSQLSKALGLDQAAVSRRLRGSTAWKVSELLAVSQLLHIEPSGLLPSMAREGDAAAEVTSHDRRLTIGPRHAAIPQRRSPAVSLLRPMRLVTSGA